MMATTLSEVFWNARCDCGWKTEAANDADAVTNKVKTHLKLAHKTRPASLAMTSYIEVRPLGVLPALGKLATRPRGVAVLPYGST
jgi:predicted small metal-binding protein